MQQKKYEIHALLLLIVSTLVLCSLVSFHGSDLTFFNASTAAQQPRNWIGFLGANLAWVAFFLFGIGAYAFPLLGFWFSYRLFRRKSPLANGWIQAGGLLLLLLTSVSLSALLEPQVCLFGQKLLSGGQIGRLISSLLVDKINHVGTYVVLIGLFLTALLLSTPFSLLTSWRVAADVLRRARAALHPLLRQFGEGMRRPPAIPPKQRPRLSTPKASTRPEKRTIRSLPAAGSQKVETLPQRTVKSVVGSEVYKLPPIDLLDHYDNEETTQDPEALEENARVLEQKLADFGVQGKVVGIQPGPVITMYEYSPAPGIKISRIVGLADDLSMALKATSIRVVAPIPGKAAIGIELPNRKRALVSARSVFESEAFRKTKNPLSIALGKDIIGHPMLTNLARMPHMLIAGATGTGKSVCINVVLNSLLYRNTPDELRLLLIDPKRIELSSYEGIPHLLHPVVTDAKMATRALRWAVDEMELRYRLIADKNVRNIENYNKVIRRELAQNKPTESPATPEKKELPHHYLPLIVIIIDELADLMMVASREVEEYITRLAQMARAAGIHLILATQRPSVDVLTGIIKANIPTRLSFQVSSKVDSRTVLDTMGAETLLGAGDMLFLPPGTAKLQRIHGAFISEKEVQRVTDFWRTQQLSSDPLAQRVNFLEPAEDGDIPAEDLDEKYDEAVELVLRTRQASISMLQRRLRVGYNRAARMIEVMEQQGIVGPSDGSKPREILLPPRT